MRQPTCDEAAAEPRAQYPVELNFILSAFEAASPPKIDARALPRKRYRVTASLDVFTDWPDQDNAVLYTRDISPRSLGFISRRNLPLGHGGLLHLPMPDGQVQDIHCRVFRCQSMAPAWFEGALLFDANQPECSAIHGSDDDES